LRFGRVDYYCIFINPLRYKDIPLIHKDIFSPREKSWPQSRLVWNEHNTSIYFNIVILGSHSVYNIIYYKRSVKQPKRVSSLSCFFNVTRFSENIFKNSRITCFELLKNTKYNLFYLIITILPISGYNLNSILQLLYVCFML